MDRDGADEDVRWDFFLSHAGADAGSAEKLYDLLSRPRRVRVFLPSRCLKLGDDWDVELARAQRSSRVTVVLVSGHTGSAYYEREEVAAAIALAREDDARHRVVPLFLGGGAESQRAIPYGLRLKHGLEISGADGWAAAATRLLELLEDLDGSPERRRRTPPSLGMALEEASWAVTAIQAFTSAIREAVKGGFDTVDLFKKRSERARLVDLLNRLSFLFSRQSGLPGDLYSYVSGDLDWSIIASDIAELAQVVEELIETLAAENGSFLIKERGEPGAFVRDREQVCSADQGSDGGTDRHRGVPRQAVGAAQPLA